MSQTMRFAEHRAGRPWLRVAVSIGALTTLWTCGEDSAGPVVPQALVIVSGDDQTGPPGDLATYDFTVRVVGSNGNPFAGASVTWAVATGGGSIAPGSTDSDASGLASARLTLGASLGENTGTATVSGLPPVTFRATAIDPCDYLRPIALGDATTGALRTPDCQLPDNTFIDFYALDVAPQQRIQIALGSTAFDAFLFFFDETDVVAADDNDGGGTNSLLQALLPAGAYAIGANSTVPGIGSYTLSVTPGPEEVTNCDFVWVIPGLTTSQQVTSTDCEIDANRFGDAFPIFLRAGVTLTVTQQSTAFDALIEIYSGSTGALVASDDNGGGGTNARVDYAIAADGVLLIVATSAAAGQGGAYSMTVVSSAPLATADRSVIPLPPRARFGEGLRERRALAPADRWVAGSAAPPRTRAR